MGQWDVHVNPNTRVRAELPYLVVVQSELLAELPTRLVIPLGRSGVAQGLMPPRLLPAFRIDADTVILLPHLAGSIDARALRRPVASLRGQAHLVLDALDAVMSGI